MTKVNREWIRAFDNRFFWSSDNGWRDAQADDVKDFIFQVLAQTRNDLLREIMEEMPKRKDANEEAMRCSVLSLDALEASEEALKFFGFNTYHDQVNTLLENKLSTVKKI